MRSIEYNPLGIVSVQLVPPAAPHEFPIGFRKGTYGSVQFTERYEPTVSVRVIAIGVSSLERQATKQNGLAFPAGCTRELMISIGIFDLDLERVLPDHCH